MVTKHYAQTEKKKCIFSYFRNVDNKIEFTVSFSHYVFSKYFQMESKSTVIIAGCGGELAKIIFVYFKDFQIWQDYGHCSNWFNFLLQMYALCKGDQDTQRQLYNMGNVKDV